MKEAEGEGATRVPPARAADSSEIGMGAMKSGLAWSMRGLLEKGSFGSRTHLLYTTQSTECVSCMGSDCRRQCYGRANESHMPAAMHLHGRQWMFLILACLNLL